MQQTHKKQVENLQKTLPKIDNKEQLPSHTDRNTTNSNVEGFPIKTYNKHNSQPLLQSDKYPARPALEMQRHLIFILIKYIICKVLETIAIRANKKTYNTSTDRSRVTHEARPDRGCKIKTSPPAMQTCQHLQEEKNTKKVNSLQAKTQVTDIKKPAQNCLVLPDKKRTQLLTKTNFLNQRITQKQPKTWSLRSMTN